MRKLPVLAMVLVVVLSLVAIGGQGAVAQAAILVVDQDAMASTTDCDALTPTPYTTITAAEAAAMSGDTIKVCPGLYAEMVSINVDNLTLKGAKAGVDARTRAFVPTDESIIDHPCGPVQIMANNVVLDGFTVQGSTTSDPCFLSGIWTNPGFSGTQGGHQILNNIVQNNISGIELDSTCVNPTLVQFNLIQNNNNPGPGAGNAIQTNFGLCNATIDSNKFSGHTNSSFLVVAASSTLDVTNNELVGGTPERIVFAFVSTSTISGNVSIGSTSSATIRLFGGDSNVTVNSNTLLNGVRGIRVDDPFAIGANSNIEGHFNCIQGNSTAGLQVDAGGHSGTLHAENNWWGSSSGPNHPSNPGGMGDAIIDPDSVVDFTPFLVSPPPALPSCPPAPLKPSLKATGGGQINVMSGRGSFGFNAKQDGSSGSGHLEYMNHVTGERLNCTVTAVTVISSAQAEFSGTCRAGSAAPSFSAQVEDNAEPGKNMDKFKITYGAHVDEGGPGPIVSGNIQIK